MTDDRKTPTGAYPPYNDMYFTRHDDGSITIHNPADEACWDLALLESATADTGLTWENGVVTFVGRNGEYSWREVGRDDIGYGHVVVRTVRAKDEAGESRG